MNIHFLRGNDILSVKNVKLLKSFSMGSSYLLARASWVYLMIYFLSNNDYQ